MLARMFFVSKNRRWWFFAGVAIVGIYVLLLIPEREPPKIPIAAKTPFAWNRDEVWRDLEAQFREARELSAAGRVAGFTEKLEQFQNALTKLTSTNLPPSAPEFDAVEMLFFRLAVLAAVTPERAQEFQQAALQFASAARTQARSWPTDSIEARQRIYRLLFGRRAALEEVMLQNERGFTAVEYADVIPVSSAPDAELHGVRIHSGDILVSRGGAATSALIARGNDFQGNFSHVALVYVDEQTKAVSIIESRIENGVSVRPIEEYLADTKLRILVLRLRNDLPAMQTNPMLPHRAASIARSNALARHIPYDFAMEHAEPTKQFCSEVVSGAYESQGIRLWSGLSRISSPGLARWLALLGVRNFESQQPSDLEYDPQLEFVAEWRNPETLLKDHLDNAVVDALLESAERGAELNFNRWLLPPMRVLKGACWMLNRGGVVGPIPEGMSATTALRVNRFKARHAAAVEKLTVAVEEFRKQNGYVPPYWELLSMARVAIEEPNP